MENNAPLQKKKKKVGVILMTYGSATTAEYVQEYMEHIYRGKIPSPEVVADFQERYRLVGGSPLIEITERQSRLLEDLLNNDDDGEYIVRAGMLHSHPFIDEAVEACREAGALRCVGIILSPQFSSFIMNGYTATFNRAALARGFREGDFSVVGPWPTEPHFIELLGERVRSALQKIQETYASDIPLIFTTHSLPKRVIDNDPTYLDQLKHTTDAVLLYLKGKGSKKDMTTFSAYQSAGHTPEVWLKPDLTDILEEVREKRAEAVLIVPIQFLVDHLEILYDLDIAAKEQCDDAGLAYHRIELPNADPLFIEALASLVRQTVFI